MRANKIIGSIAVGLVLIVVEACNFLYGYSLANAQATATALGVASLAIGLFKVCLPFIIVNAYRRAQPVRFLVAILLLAGCVGFSYTSTVGALSQAKLDRASEREDGARKANVLQAQISALEAQIASIGHVRPVAVIEADQKTIDRDFSLTWKQRRTKSGKLNVELAGAREKDRLQAELTKARERLAATKVLVADAQAEALARIYKVLSASEWQFLIIAVVPWLLEAVSAFGFYVVLGERKAQAIREDREPEEIEAPSATVLEHPHVAQLRAFKEERLVEDDGGSISAQEMFDAYQDWCAAREELALSHSAFGVLFPLLHPKSEKPNRTRHYEGLSFKDNRIGGMKPDPPAVLVA